MFLKADGTEVWLKGSERFPYLAMSGVIETPDDYAKIRPRLLRAYDLLYGIASDDAFLVHKLEGYGALVFCARLDKSCALLLLGKVHRRGEMEEPRAILETLVEVIGNSIDGIGLQAGANIRLDVVQAELAMHAG
ncbi:hypothetical protein [Mesorhizobium sp.]|uniref:hypothetical protein n=1 Tax=Mesorhizobium sp. TaxID=1871066 RepID=UPI000FE6F270|nr:MAG: hypothetical protein EOR03_28290 [Mesorhizobium sp.]